MYIYQLIRPRGNIDNFQTGNNGLFRSFQEIIRRVREAEVPVFRPTVLNIIEELDDLRDLMKTCWEEDPDFRPDFPEIKRRINRILVTGGM